ncbi:MAG: Hpt domain-containing protein, partial [Ignavibacteria bacterium]|nr:Hpt domain-containing protein [Ignavibacteria bacterium]
LQEIIERWGVLLAPQKNNMRDLLEHEKTITQFVDENKISFLTDLQTEDELLFFIEVLDIFLADTPKLVELTAEAVKNKNAQNMIFYAHKLKGSCVTLALDEISKIAADLENLGRENSFEGTDEKIVRLEEIFLLTVRDLKFLKQKHQKMVRSISMLK